MSEEVDLAVVTDHKLAERIAKALKQAGIACYEFWPEDVIVDGTGLLKPAPFVPPTTVVGGAGPFHICVAEEDLGKARDLLLGLGLTGQIQAEATADEAMREVARTGLQMHALALRRFIADRGVAVEIWPAGSHRVLGLFETHDAPYRIMVPAAQFAEAQALLAKTDMDLAIDGSPPKP